MKFSGQPNRQKPIAFPIITVVAEVLGQSTEKPGSQLMFLQSDAEHRQDDL